MYFVYHVVAYTRCLRRHSRVSPYPARGYRREGSNTALKPTTWYALSRFPTTKDPPCRTLSHKTRPPAPTCFLLWHLLVSRTSPATACHTRCTISRSCVVRGRVTLCSTFPLLRFWPTKKKKKKKTIKATGKNFFQQRFHSGFFPFSFQQPITFAFFGALLVALPEWVCSCLQINVASRKLVFFP